MVHDIGNGWLNAVWSVVLCVYMKADGEKRTNKIYRMKCASDELQLVHKTYGIS